MLKNVEAKIGAYSVDPSISIIDALRKMDSERTKMLFVFDKGVFVSILTIGDVQRSIIRGLSLYEKIENIVDYNKIFISPNTPIDEIKKIMIRERCQFMPIVNSRREIVDVLIWDELFQISQEVERESLNIPVVIMAGGKGTRLKPITNVIPKPLVPVGDKTILEVILDQFESIGCRKFYLSINYKADLLKYYIKSLEHHYDIDFFMEDRPLGTIGSVSLLKGKINTPFFVSNCDSINEQDYRDVYDYHVNNQNDMTIVTMVKSITMPYGVIETGKDGLMLEIKEKPEHTFQVNTGVYILNPDLINDIPEGEFFHITQLMEKIKERGGRVGCFPVSEQSWKDMGEWPEYLKMINVR